MNKTSCLPALFAAFPAQSLAPAIDLIDGDATSGDFHKMTMPLFLRKIRTSERLRRGFRLLVTQLLRKRASVAFLLLLNFYQSTSAQPRISSLEPASITALSGSFTLKVNGSGLAFGSRIYWNGIPQITSYSSSQLSCTIPDTYIANGGTATVNVSSDRVSFSNALTFTILNPAPTIESVTPTLVTIGGPEFTLTVSGTGFLSVSKVRWNGADRPTTSVSSTTLTAKIPSSDIASGGKARVTVFNPSPAGGTTTVKNVVIGNPVPTITSFEPVRVTCGGKAFTMTVNGSGFIAGSEVRWNNKTRTTKYVNSSQLTAEIYASDIAIGGLSVTVTVFNPSPGGGPSNGLGLSIQYDTPTTTSLEPASATAGSGGFSLKVKGSCFEDPIVVWGGSERPTTYISSSELTAAISASDIAAVGPVAVAVFNKLHNRPSGTSSAQTFTILNPAPTISALEPASIKSGGDLFTLTVTGTNFLPTSRVRWDGSDRPTTYLSSKKLSATISAKDIERTTPPRDRTATLTVFNPLPGGGDSNAQTFNVTKQ